MHAPKWLMRDKLQGTELRDLDAFYSKVSAQAGYMNPEAVKMVYEALVKVVVRDIKAHGLSRLPHLCDLGIVKLSGSSTTQLFNTRPGETRYAVKASVLQSLKAHIRDWIKQAPDNALFLAEQKPINKDIIND